MKDWLPSCLDEISKIAAYVRDSEVKLNPAEKRKQMLQFAGLGATLVPAMSATSSKMMTGKWMPKGVSPKRFWPAAVATGLFWGGAMPTIQHAMARSNLQKARQRISAEKELRALAPAVAHAPSEQEVALPPSPMKEV